MLCSHGLPALPFPSSFQDWLTTWDDGRLQISIKRTISQRRHKVRMDHFLDVLGGGLHDVLALKKNYLLSRLHPVSMVDITSGVEYLLRSAGFGGNATCSWLGR